MMRPDRVIVFLVSLAMLAACGAQPREPAVPCSGDEQCGASARCVGDTCVANSPPLASFLTAGELVSNALVTLDASASTDPDERDEVASYAWTVEAVEAGCAPPAVAATTAVAKVRFGCAGTYAIHLVVEDTMGAASAPVTRGVTVAAGPSSVVSAGVDQAVQHGCAGTPLRCGLATAVRLAGSVSSVPSGAVTYQWTAVPPANLPLDATRRVRFTPAANVPDPTVEVETDATAISGDWVFRLEVRDGVSALGSDDMRLSVGNRPPVVTSTALDAYPHTYDPTTRTYRSSGTVGVRVSDPDGDPVARKVEWRHSGDGGGLFDGLDSGTSVTFRVAVTDPLSLAGGSGLERSVVISATDVNGGATAEAATVLVGNRPPTHAGATSATVGHGFDPATRTFFSATARLGSWTDPDGDPVTAVAATGDPGCASGPSTNPVTVSCSAPYTGLDALALFVGPRHLDLRASDPWIAGAGAVTLTITDRAPSAGGATFNAPRRCAFGSVHSVCCRRVFGICAVYGNEYGGNTLNVPLGVWDPDGDPLQLSARGGDPAAPLVVSCDATGCYGALTLPVVQGCVDTASYLLAIQVSDGVALASGSTVVATSCL